MSGDRAPTTHALGVTLLEKLISKFERKESKVGIVGLGYVGLPLAIRFAACGYRIVGFDVDLSKIQSLIQQLL